MSANWIPFGVNALDALLLLSLVTGLGLLFLGNSKPARWLALLLHALMLALVVQLGMDIHANPDGVASALSFQLFGETLHWKMDGLGWFFAMIAVGAGFFSSWYASGEWGESQKHIGFQNSLLALNVFAMVLVLSSGDLLSLFIGWEVLSWASYAIMTQAGGKAAKSAYRYLIYGLAGAMAVLVAIFMIRTQTGSFSFDAFHQAVPSMSSAMLWGLVLLFGSGFGVKMAIMPFHLWQADAYAETPGASGAFLNAISGRIGLFAIALTLFRLIGLDVLGELAIPLTWLDARTMLLWIGAFTMVVPTFIALQQTDARLLLAWHGVGQGGYMLVGLLVATQLGVAGGFAHVFNHATYQAALFLAVIAVLHRTGTTDLDRLGGLITRMPFTYVALLMGIIGLAGLPPMNGFVSKWMIYKGLLAADMPLLLIAAFIGTLGTILSVYKLIHNIFLGQLRKEHQAIKEAPLSMVLPMLILAGTGFVTGVAPGLVLNMVSLAQNALGMDMPNYHMGGLTLVGGSLNMFWVVGILVGGIGVGALIFYVLGNKSRGVHQFDNYAGGHFLSSDVRYHYSHEFYPGLNRVILPWYNGWIAKIEGGLAQGAQVAGDLWRGVYRASSTPIYLVLALVVGALWIANTGGF
jgi:NADH-quinone oxidoreductase subunit M